MKKISSEGAKGRIRASMRSNSVLSYIYHVEKSTRNTNNTNINNDGLKKRSTSNCRGSIDISA